jgi:1,4-dihydroxy-2-naphthoate octaprenyltransferase
MNKTIYTFILLLVTILMLIMVLSIVNHYRDEIRSLNVRIKKLEVIISKDN